MTVRLQVATRKWLGSILSALSAMLLGAGLFLVGWPLFVIIQSEVVQWQGSRQLDKTPLLAEAAARPVALPTHGPTEVVVPWERSQPRNPAEASVKTGSVLAKLEIERLGMSLVVLEGSDARTLDKSIGHVESTALPGEMGNIGIAGHRNTHFRKLERIQPGDVIKLETGQDEFRYTVEWIRLFTPNDLYVLDPSHGPAVTLITCFPFEYVGSAPQRFIVRALPDVETREKLASRTALSWNR